MLQITLDIAPYNSDEGIRYKWEFNFEITAKIVDNEILITANRAGLISLATQLLTLAQDDVPVGTHLHYDEYNSLEEGSNALMIQKK